MATARQLKARAEGTQRNNRLGARTYLAFMWRARKDPHQPHHSMVCTFLEYLSSHVNAPSTIRNYLSQARVHVALVTGEVHPMSHMRITRAMEAINRNKAYVPKEKQAVPMDVLQPILIRLHGSPTMNAVRAALLVQYYGALRPGEVTPPSKAKFRSICHLTRGDVTFTGRQMEVRIKSGKTLQRTGQNKIIRLMPASDRELCVVAACRQMCMDTPTMHKDDPLFMFTDTREPIPTSEIRKHWKQGLMDLGLPEALYTLHGLRIAAATQAYDAGASELDVQRYGGWKSNVHRTYIRTAADRDVNNKLISALGYN